MAVRFNRGLRERAGMTQEELAQALKVDRSTVTKWETGDALPRTKDLPDVARVLKCTVNDLLCADSEETAQSPA